MYKPYMPFMQEEVTTVVRVPISRLEEDIRKKHAIALNLMSVSLEKDAVVLQFGNQTTSTSAQITSEEFPPLPSRAGVKDSSATFPPGSRLIELASSIRRRRPSKRNRMKTRGWNIVTKIVNSKGQTVTIYEPFVEALRGKKLPRKQMENLVAATLKENGNRPGPVSIDYYLSNTLEYLAKEGNG